MLIETTTNERQRGDCRRTEFISASERAYRKNVFSNRQEIERHISKPQKYPDHHSGNCLLTLGTDGVSGNLFQWALFPCTLPFQKAAFIRLQLLLVIPKTLQSPLCILFALDQLLVVESACGLSCHSAKSHIVRFEHELNCKTLTFSPIQSRTFLFVVHPFGSRSTLRCRKCTWVELSFCIQNLQRVTL